MANPFGHVDVRVTSLEECEPFYAVLMPEVGFTIDASGSEWRSWGSEGVLPSGAAYFAITEDPAHVPNANRIAFWAATREKVDRVATVIRNLGKITSGPKDFPEYAGGGIYYAVYFEDPCGNRLEIVYRG